MKTKEKKEVKEMEGLKFRGSKTLFFSLIAIFSISSISKGASYIVPSDIDEYKRKTDTAVDFIFNKLCKTKNSSLVCDLSSVPSNIYENVILSEVKSITIPISVNLKGTDRIKFCDDYSTGTNCKEFQIDDHTSFRFEIIPFDKIDTYEIVPPKCSTTSFPVAVPLMFTHCSIGAGDGKAFSLSGTNWKLNPSCFPSNMNLPILVFCNTYSK